MLPIFESYNDGTSSKCNYFSTIEYSDGLPSDRFNIANKVLDLFSLPSCQAYIANVLVNIVFNYSKGEHSNTFALLCGLSIRTEGKKQMLTCLETVLYRICL